MNNITIMWWHDRYPFRQKMLRHEVIEILPKLKQKVTEILSKCATILKHKRNKMPANAKQKKFQMVEKFARYQIIKS